MARLATVLREKSMFQRRVGPIADAGDGGPPEPASTAALWWAEDLGQADGAVVSSWIDRVNGLTVAQSNNTFRPTMDVDGVGGQKAVHFDGTDDRLVLTASSPVSTATSGCVVAVVVLDVGAGNDTVWSSSDEATITTFLRANLVDAGTIHHGIQQRNADTNSYFRAAGALNNATAYVLEWSSSGSAWSFRINNVTQSVTTVSGTNNGDWFGDTANRDNFVMGASVTSSVSGFFDGKLALLLVADAELSSGDRTELYDWLTDFYGVP